MNYCGVFVAFGDKGETGGEIVLVFLSRELFLLLLLAFQDSEEEKANLIQYLLKVF